MKVLRKPTGGYEGGLFVVVGEEAEMLFLEFIKRKKRRVFRY